MGKVGGKAVFVPFSAPGDILEVELTEKHKNFEKGIIKKIIRPAACREEPVCPYFNVCGGCHLQQINYATQIMWKQIMLEEQLRRIGGIKDIEVLPTIPSPKIWNYRRRIQLHKKGSRVGFKMMESDEVVDVEKCPVAETFVNDKLKEIRKKWPVKEKRFEIAAGEAGVFEQVNSDANESMKKLLLDWAREGALEKVLELYAGSGNLTASLLNIAKDIVAVEADERAVERLARLNGVQAVCSTAEDFITFSRPEGEAIKGKMKNLDLLLVDPPREGLSSGVVKGITKLKPPRIMYVSCNPSTLARDLKIFLSHGYTLKRMQPIDMFPQTYHIESITELIRK